jgi:hypothetical protein
LNECEHTSSEVRKRYVRGGGVQVREQCLTCGSTLGPALKQSAQLLEQLNEWDEELQDAYWERDRRAREREVAQRVEEASRANADWWAFYGQHIQSEKWKDIRRAVIRRCGNRCEGCMAAPVEHVHHLDYANLGDELLFQLVGLCLSCHQRVHPDRDLSGGAA